MPPQFFKDAHSVLNNKFVPRSFALNLNAKETSEDNVSGDQTFEGSGDSSVTPRATSTAPSTGLSSKFFGAYAGGKVQNDHHEDILEDSSMENFEDMVQPHRNIKEDQPSKEVTPVSAGRASTAGSDVLEITDVKEVTQIDKPPLEFPKPTTYDKDSLETQGVNDRAEFQSAETSSDLIMEALMKSQRLCTQYKQKLSKAESKIIGQEDEISSSKKAVETLKSSVRKSKELLSALEAKSNSLYETHKEESSHSSSIKHDIKDLLKQLEQQRNETLSLKKKFDYLRQIKTSTGYELEKKNKEIEHFQERLDETSGLLSEQKIKCSELEKKLESCRKEYDEKLCSHLKDSEKAQGGLQDSLSKFKNDVVKDLGSNISQILPLLDKHSSHVDSKVEQLIESVNNSLKLTEEGITSSLKNNEHVSKEASTNLADFTEFLKPKMVKVTSDQAFVNSVCTQVLDEFKQLVNDIKKNHSRTAEIETSCKGVISSIETLEDKVKECSVDAEKITSLMECNQLKEQEISKQKLDINGLHVQNELLSKEIDTLKGERQRLGSEKDEASKKFIEISDEYKNYVSQSEQKAAKSKSTSESKLRTQMEIHKLVGEERDKLKQDLELRNTALSGLQAELLTLKDTLLAKEELIGTYENDKSTVGKYNKELEAEITRLRDENKRLCDKIDAQIKPEIIKPQNVVAPAIVSQESTNDLEMTASFQDYVKNPASKPVPSKPVSNASNPKQSDSRKKTIVSKYTKRKKLLDDDDSDNIFDDFEFDETKSDHQIAPKRYTKRKKTINSGVQKSKK